MKITILWSQLASYSIAFFRELSIKHGCDIQLFYQPVSQEAPYEPFDLSFCVESIEDVPEKKSIIQELCMKFKPDCILMSSWSFPHYMRVAKKLKRCGCYVVSVMDNQWVGSIKQRIGILLSRWFLKSTIDTFLVAGDRQACFARKLGYDDVMYGCYAADISIFNCKKPLTKRDRNFLFVGRLITIKGIDLLVNAYQRYRCIVKQPWGLIIAGTGGMASKVVGIPGVKHLGFISPKQLVVFMSQARCLVLPSRFDPWGVVIHEASSAGLPIIATYSCGATVNYVRDGVNGFIVTPTVDKLTKAMCLVSELNDDDLDALGEASSKLASMWSPQILARYFYFSIGSRRMGV